MNNLELAFHELDQEWFATLPAPEDVPHFKVSQRFLKWEQRVIYGKKSAASKAAKVVLIAAALIVLLSVIALSTGKGREFLKEFFGNSAVFSLQASQSPEVSSLTFAYLPQGYRLQDSDETKISIGYRYANNNKWFQVRKTGLETTVDFHYDSSQYKTHEKDGIVYYLTIGKEGYYAVIWNFNNYSYQISGNLAEEELLKIAYGMR